MKVRNTFIIFIVSGFWHGANWTFVVWGALNALYFLPILLTKRNRQNLETVAEGRYLPSIIEFLNMALTFGLTVIAWVFFRAENMGHAMHYLSAMLSYSLFKVPYYEGIGFATSTLMLLTFFIIIEWIGRENEYAIEKLNFFRNRFQRWVFYIIIIFLIGMFMHTEETEFIYFQF